MKIDYISVGKQILAKVAGQRPIHVADCCDEKAATLIAKLLNDNEVDVRVDRVPQW